jgi:hypothetical protein
VTASCRQKWPIGALFFKFEVHQTSITVSSGLSHQTQQAQIKKKVAKNAVTVSVTPNWMGRIAL